MLRVLFFAQTRELIGLDAIEVNENFTTVEELRQHLTAKGDNFRARADVRPTCRLSLVERRKFSGCHGDVCGQSA